MFTSLHSRPEWIVLLGLLACANSAAADEFYRVDFETDDGSPVWSAILPSTARRYEAPPWIVSLAGGRRIRWRVTGLAADGSRSSGSTWRPLRAP